MNNPARITQDFLDSQRSPDDVCTIRVELHGCYNYRPVPVAGKGTTRYMFTHDPKANCHALHVPSGVWTRNDDAMAKNLMMAPFTSYKLMVTVRPLPAKEAALPEIPQSKTKGKKNSAAETAEAILNKA